MDTLTAIRERRSIREYTDQPVESDKLNQVLDAARLAPSARNTQQWKFIVVRNPDQRQRLAAATKHKFIADAPIIIAGVALDPDKMMACQVPTYAVDLSIAMTNITLAATAIGLGTCWIGGFDQDIAREVLDIPDQYKVVELMPLGYPKNQPEAKPRKELSEIVCYDYFD